MTTRSGCGPSSRRTPAEGLRGLPTSFAHEAAKDWMRSGPDRLLRVRLNLTLGLLCLDRDRTEVDVAALAARMQRDVSEAAARAAM